MMVSTTYTQIQIAETANSFRKLCYIYEEDTIIKEQLLETARILDELSGIEEKNVEISEDKMRKIRKVFKHNGVMLEGLKVFTRKNGRTFLETELRSIRGNSIRTEYIGRLFKDFFDGKFVPTEYSRRYIGASTEKIMYETDTVYHTISGITANSMDDVSGDVYTCMQDQGGMTYVCVCDGMGTGEEAAQTSRIVIEMMEQFFETGFSELVGIKLVNSAIVSHSDEKAYTLDLAVFDLYNGKCRMIKVGAMASYIIKKTGVEIVRPSSLPGGIFENVEPDVEEFILEDGDYVVMVTDGVVEALPFYNKEYQMSRIIADIPKCSPKEMADLIRKEILYYIGDYKDDMTIMVTGIWKK